MRQLVFAAALSALVTTACGPVPDNELIFLDGRATAPAGDSLIAITGSSVPGVLLYDRRTRTIDTLGADELQSPAHIQWAAGRWYVSDVRDGLASIVVLTPAGDVERRIDVDSISGALHQFAVLPDGSIILETRDDRLVAVRAGEISTFALIESSQRTGLLAAAQGGVLHLVPQASITLYNELGKIRWRVPWDWDDSVFITDISVDSKGRPNVLAGREGFDGFMVFGFSPLTGEVVRWREGPSVTFSVDRFGEILPDSASLWLAGVPGG